MTVSVFDMFSVGVGPSSSHTVGPMRAAAMFADQLQSIGVLAVTSTVRVDLYGSLAATGRGHGTLAAVLLGLERHRPETVDQDRMDRSRARMRASGVVELGGTIRIPLTEDGIVLHPLTVVEEHPNAMRLTASADDDSVLFTEMYFSVGGGFVVTGSGSTTATTPEPTGGVFSFRSAEDLLRLAGRHGLSIGEIMARFECETRSDDEVRDHLRYIARVMRECQERGFQRDGLLPGGLGVERRAPEWHRRLGAEDPHRDPAFAEDWVNLVALAVNEENAAGGRVVTAPTNGAAGIIPAVLHYALHYSARGVEHPDEATVAFLLTAGAIGSLYKDGASISGAEVGCQGEVGVAASMAAAGLAEVLGGTPAQVENAAEIAMEHSLGLTCDPVGGLVQIPCIERNAISAGKAINAARMALRGNGNHRVSLDQVIATMRETGADMSRKYKETSTGGLAVAVNFVEC